MDRRYLRGYVLRADDEDQVDESKPLTIVAATEGRKGDGLNLKMDVGDLARFEANPVVGYGHSYWGRDGLPIGRADKTWIDGERLMMDITFDQDDEFARTVERKYRAGFMSAFSIGFEVWGIDDDGTPEGWELYEVSAVPLPMDPNAIVESGRETEALVRSLLAGHPDDALPGVDVDALRKLLGGRAGKVLSKANKKLVKDAVTALQALLDAAGGSDDEDDEKDEDDEGRDTLTSAERDELERLRANEARRRRLAGITP